MFCCIFHLVRCFRLKQEKDYEKRAKEKMQREEIFQSYLQRKAVEDGSEEVSKISSRGTGKRLVKSGAKLHRPKSQPPPSSDIHLYERGFSTPSSVGGLVTDPRTGSPSSDLSRSERLIEVRKIGPVHFIFFGPRVSNNDLKQNLWHVKSYIKFGI